jgi:hypothetical protein
LVARKFCNNPVPPLTENLTGYGEVYPDPNPICEECIDFDFDVLEKLSNDKNELPF